MSPEPGGAAPGDARCPVSARPPRPALCPRPVPGTLAPPLERAAMPAAASRRLDEQDTVVLQLLQLAVELILAHCDLMPPALYAHFDAWADDLAAVLGRRCGRRRPPRGRAVTAARSYPGAAGSPRRRRRAGQPGKPAHQDRDPGGTAFAEGTAVSTTTIAALNPQDGAATAPPAAARRGPGPTMRPDPRRESADRGERKAPVDSRLPAHVARAA